MPQWYRDYLHQDYTATTPHDYLSLIAPLTEGEHIVEALQATAEECALLHITHDPCLADPSSHLVDNPTSSPRAPAVPPVADIVCRGALSPDPRWRQQKRDC